MAPSDQWRRLRSADRIPTLARAFAATLLATCTATIATVPLHAQGSEPLSAIDWLSRSVLSTPQQQQQGEAPVTQSAATPQITVTALDGPSTDGVGLLGPQATGLPRTLWSASGQDRLVALLQAQRVELLPAIQSLLVTLMLAEADPPLDAGSDGRLFLARVDKLLDLGALDPAQALLDEAGVQDPALLRRRFDVALLTGSEDAVCAMMSERPDIAPTFPARIFCLARGGDWMAAALTLNTARVLGEVSDEEDALLARFLDPEFFEDLGPTPPPGRISPLVFRMREAIGEPIPTVTLPRAFSHADLRFTTGWKSQIEAAERLARNGAIPDSALFDLYAARRRAASGGVWERVEAIQGLNAALDAQDASAVADALPAAWAAMQQVRTEVPFARLYAPRLSGLALQDDAAALVFVIGLLSDDYEAIARAKTPADATERFLMAIATGNVAGIPAPAPDAAPVRAAFDASPASASVPAPFATQLAEGKLGEVLLQAIAMFDEGLDGDSTALTNALVILRAVGLEDVARRAALQILLMERRS